MAISSEIEKLEKRWQQTSGLVFAPLAEAYRKAGLQARALEILEQGLALHADYGPALIVRARCHLDTGDFPAAEAAFDQALGRDPHDPIALRGLADVFERTGRLPEAIERLRTLVDVDPRNSEARLVLDRMLATPAEIPQPIASEPVPEPFSQAAEPGRDQLDSLDFDVVNLSAVESLPAIPENKIDAPIDEEFAVQSFDVEPLDVPPVVEPAGPILWTPASAEPVAEAAPPPAPEPEVFPEAVSFEPAPGPEHLSEPELVIFEAPVAEIPVELPASATAEVPEPFSETPEPVDEIPATVAEMPASVAEFPEFIAEVPEVAPAIPEPVAEIPTAFEDIPELVEEPTVEEYASRVDSPAEFESIEAELEPGPAAELEAAVEFAGASAYVSEATDAADAADTPAEPPAVIVTESMAELFLKQGHRELALAVYRQLAERTPESDGIRGAIARLEQELAPPPSPPALERKPYAAALTGGRSVERRLQAVLHAPPPSTASTVLPPAIEPGAEPTRPSSDSLSLSAVFGDEPAPRPRQEEPAASTSNAAEPSYDEFFGAGPSEPAAAPAPRGEGEDLRQFNEWLKGLKR